MATTARRTPIMTVSTGERDVITPPVIPSVEEAKSLGKEIMLVMGEKTDEPFRYKKSEQNTNDEFDER